MSAHGIDGLAEPPVGGDGSGMSATELDVHKSLDAHGDGAAEDGDSPVYIVASVKGGKIIHGAYLVTGSGHLDQRSRLAKTLKDLRAHLAASLGASAWDELSLQQQIIGERMLRKAMACALMEANWDRTGRLPVDYLKFAHSMRRDLEALGIEKRLKDSKVIDLAAQLARLNSQEVVRK